MSAAEYTLAVQNLSVSVARFRMAERCAEASIGACSTLFAHLRARLDMERAGR